MRLHNKGLGLRGPLVVLKLGVIGGLLALLMLVAAACDEQAQPAGSTTTGESPGTSAPTPTTDGPDVSRSPSPDIELAAEGTWVLELLDGRPVIEDSAITLRIGDDCRWALISSNRPCPRMCFSRRWRKLRIVVSSGRAPDSFRPTNLLTDLAS